MDILHELYHDSGQTVLDILQIIGLVVVWTEARIARRMFYEHEKECAERWGQVKTTMKVIE